MKGPLHALRGSGDDERLLKNAKTEYSEEAEEIATYSAIEAFAESVADRDTAKLARDIKRQEERMANHLERLIPQLTRAVVRAEVPSDQRPKLRALLSFRWDRVKAVRTVRGARRVYDLRVPQFRNYVAGGLIVHNTADPAAHTNAATSMAANAATSAPITPDRSSVLTRA